MSLAARITALADRIGDECKALWTAVGGKQATLVSGTNIKTVNSQSLLGSGNITVEGGGGGYGTPVTVTPSGNTHTIDYSAGAYFNVSVTGEPLRLVGKSKQSFGSSTTGTFTLPTGLKEGDLVIVCVGSDGGTAIGLPSGWTAINNTASTDEYTRTFCKIMTSTPDASVALTGLATSSAAMSIAFRNVHADMFDVTTVVITGTTGMPNCGSITPVTNNGIVLAIGYLDDDNIVPTVPSGYENFDYINSSTVGQTVMLATKSFTSAAAQDPAAYGGSGTDAWVAVTIAIKPANQPQTIAMSNLPNDGAVHEIAVLLNSDTNDGIIFPASWQWKFKPISLDIYDDILLKLTTDDNGSTWYVETQSSLAEYAKHATIAAADIDWSSASLFRKTLTGNTTFTFSNLIADKVITLVISGNYTVTWPSYCKKLAGNYSGAKSNYIQMHCTNAAPGQEEVWRTINQEIT